MAGVSNHVKNRVLESFSKIFFPLAGNQFHTSSIDMMRGTFDQARAKTI